jgi:hypothetical protein
MNRFRQLGVFDPRAQLGELVAFTLAKLGLNGFELLAQVVLALRVGHLLLRLRLDLALQLEERHFARQRAGEDLQLLQEVVLLEQRLLVAGLHVEDGRQHVGEPQRVVDVHHAAAKLFGEPCRQRERLLDELLDPADVRVHFDGALDQLGHRRDLRTHRRTRPRHERRAHARDPLDDDVDAGADLCHLADDADGSNLPQILGARVVDVVLLQEQQDEPIGPERAIDGLDGNRPIDRQWLQRQRERHRASERQDGKLGREAGRRRFSQGSQFTVPCSFWCFALGIPPVAFGRASCRTGITAGLDVL